MCRYLCWGLVRDTLSSCIVYITLYCTYKTQHTHPVSQLMATYCWSKSYTYFDRLNLSCLQLTYFANEGVLLVAIGDVHGGECEGGALRDVVYVVHPHAVAILEPLVLTPNEVVERRVVDVTTHVRHGRVIRL
jgi:hypothetical protein